MLPITMTVAVLIATAALRFDADRLAVVDVWLDGRGPFPMAVDTAATTTMLDESIARALGLARTGRVELTTVAGVIVADTGALGELALAGLRVRGLEVSWTRLSRLREGRPHLAGVLGQDVLSRGTLTLDYRNRRLTLHAGASCDGGTRVSATWEAGRPAVDARLRAPGVPEHARLVLDSAADTVLLFSSLTRGAAQQAGATRVVLTHDGRLKATAIPNLRLGVGGMWLETRAVAAAVAGRREDGLMPTSAFKKVCIDGPTSTITLTAW